MKSYLKFVLLLVGLSLLLWQCQKDNFIETVQTEITESIFKTNTVKLSDIPDVKDFLTHKSKTNIFSQKTIIDGAIFDQDNIMEVIDTLNRTNYSFRFTYPSTPKGVYYNLVVGKSPEGVLKVPYVLKYVTDDAYTDAFIENNYDFRFFKGTVGLHKFTDYFQQGTAFKTAGDTYCPPEYDAFGDPIACDNLNLDGSGFNTSSGGGTDVGDSSLCFLTASYEPCGCGGNADGHAPSGVPCCQGSPTILTLNCPGMYKMSQTNTALKTSTTSTDCPTCPTDSGGGVGVSLGDVEDPFNPCKNINELFTQAPFKDAISQLQSTLQNNTNSEEGFEISKNDKGFISTTFKQGGFDGVTLGSGGNIIGGMHIHTDDGNPMFSGPDIIKLREYFHNGRIGNPNLLQSDVFLILVTDIGTFAISINNWGLLQYIANNIDNNSGGVDLDLKLQALYDNTINGTNANAYMQDLLKFFTDSSLTPTPAINLHKLNFDGTAFEKVTLDANNSPQSSPCQ